MLQSKNTISLIQAMLICIVMEFTPFVRIAGGFVAQNAKQAGWVSVIVAIVPMVTFFYIFSIFYKKYGNADFMDIIKDIMGGIIGRFIIVFYSVWLVLLLALYIRYFAERILSTLMPTVNISFIIITMLVVVALVLRSGITVIARMNEVIIVIVAVSLALIYIFGIYLVKPENLLPVYYTDIVPAIKGSMVIWAIFGYMIVLFFFSKQINDKEHILKYGMYKGIILVITNTLLVVYIIGSLGWTVAERLPFSTFTMVRQISVFGVIERIETFLIAVWVFSDFILISVFSYAILYIIKDFFKLDSYKPLIMPFLIWAYFLAFLIANNIFELGKSSDVFFVPANIVFEFVIPILILIVGKVRRKV